ncbi:MAG: DUF3841 domain-containing protein [Finegoldia sp.]|nr:DUF3841 domain-containing protein [Finegoldia sp.]
MDKVSLFTRQNENSYYELMKKGRITNKEIYIRLHMGDMAEYFIGRYKKFVEMAEKIVERPDYTAFPIWCSVSKKNCMKPIEKEIVYCLEVPHDQVIYFDGGKWDYVLNGLYIPKNAEDRAKYRKEIERLGVKDEFNFIDGRYKGMYPKIEKKIVDSWERIFEIDKWNEFVVQANLWEIKREWVKHIVREGEDLMAICADMEETFPPDAFTLN